ncbi:hypothetical protein HanXRQr2_Chr11g0514661 [Helianthus annuus]|uniref:Uncharacterized protein n=1 Tax=Helianthus annuus TaxID=4232 RepID=A0A251TDL3_HELAN|nr:hypothetical protein HanXRQr2_Chr11g0514661 [Helianthus annuus]KAJ0877078.1 hypothetical protein HanPSC8_Chr11g0495981 [Helianthus annuus]
MFKLEDLPSIFQSFLKGDDDYPTGGSLCSKDSPRFLSIYCSPCKRQRSSDS